MYGGASRKGGHHRAEKAPVPDTAVADAYSLCLRWLNPAGVKQAGCSRKPRTARSVARLRGRRGLALNEGQLQVADQLHKVGRHALPPLVLTLLLPPSTASVGRARGRRAEACLSCAARHAFTSLWEGVARQSARGAAFRSFAADVSTTGRAPSPRAEKARRPVDRRLGVKRATAEPTASREARVLAFLLCFRLGLAL